MLQALEFAIVDVETTGRSRNDRIVEIAVVRMDRYLKVRDEYCTLVNPRRDVGAVHLHGITASDVRHAPLFEEVAGDVISRLAGAVFVAHNAHFDMRFLRGEMRRCHCELPDFPFLCTMQLARRADPEIPSRRLGELCKHFGITITNAHSALGDALAEAQLLAVCLARVEDGHELSLQNTGVTGRPLAREHWPTMVALRGPYPRSKAAEQRRVQHHYIAKLIARLPAETGSEPHLDEYLLLLDRALEDRRVTKEEVDSLHALTKELGISQNQAILAHEGYMRDLIRVALEDDVITEAERKDLHDVRKLLDISSADFERMLRDVDKQRGSCGIDPCAAIKIRSNISGKTICFTGELAGLINGAPVSRSLAQTMATEKGMIVKGSVVKSLDYLVAADPDSMSGKAERARRYGVRVLSEPVFWQMLGVSVE